MKIGVLGTGMVGRTIATKLVERGHQVMMGSRSASGEKAVAWAKGAGRGASNGTFADAARHGEVVFNCTAGSASLEALGAAGAESLGGKVLVDVANPLDFSQGTPPRLTVCNTDSLAERIQRACPEVRVVKALNTVNCAVMVAPDRVPGAHYVPLCGNDAAAKAEVKRLLVEGFGWRAEQLVDLGDLTGARGMEMWLPLWVRLYGTIGHGVFNVEVRVGEKG